MLVALKGRDGADVLDAICELFRPMLETWRGKPITASLLSKGIKAKYGWNVTDSVAQTFLTRLERNGDLSRQGDTHAGPLISTPKEFDVTLSDTDMYGLFEGVIDLFEQFPLVCDGLIYRELGREKLSELLVRYLILLDAYSEDEIAAQLREQKAKNGEILVDVLVAEDRKLTGEEVYICARFVTWVSENKSELLPALSAIVSAGLLAELVEDFRKPDTVLTASSTTIFLDAPLALSLLGASGKAAQAEAKAIQQSLSSIGCKVMVLSKSCAEAERVLEAFLKTRPEQRFGLTQRAVISKEVGIDYIRVLQSDIETALAKYEVETRHIDLMQLPNQKQYFDEARVDDMVAKLSWQHWDAREHDAYAIAIVMRLRQGRHSTDPLKNMYLFATSNSILVGKARRYCVSEDLTRSSQYGPAIDLRDLATIAWLRTGFGESDKLPVAHLLSQCEKVLRVRKDVIEAAKEQVLKYSPEKNEQFELLLQDNRAITHLTDTALLSPSEGTRADTEALLNGMLDAAISVATEEGKEKLREKERELRVANRTAKTQEKDTKIQHTAEMGALQSEVDDLREATSELGGVRDTLHRRDQAIIRKAIRRANIFASAFQVICAIVLLALSYAVIAELLVEQPHFLVDWGAKAFVLISLTMSVLALMGKGFIGLNGIEAKIASYVFVSLCKSYGVWAEELEEKVERRGGRILIRAGEM